MRGIIGSMTEELKTFGPEGEAYAMTFDGFVALADGFDAFAAAGTNAAKKLEATKSIIGSIGDVMAGASKAAIAGIDQQIAAEEKRDGKSKESLKKIQALKVKKYQMEKKEFETNKKIKTAQALISTYTAVTEAYAKYGIFGGAIALALGMAQVKAIQNTQFGGTNPAGSAGGGSPSELTVGKRDNRVDTSMGGSAGELAYLRGQRGIGSNANNFTPIGGAAGLKTYSGGGEILVGETGPETIRPTQSGYQVNPNDTLGQQAPTNVNFTINTIDSQGVQEFLETNQGAIIGTIRSAANAHGEDFMEVIDTESISGSGGGGYG